MKLRKKWFSISQFRKNPGPSHGRSSLSLSYDARGKAAHPSFAHDLLSVAVPQRPILILVLALQVGSRKDSCIPMRFAYIVV